MNVQVDFDSFFGLTLGHARTHARLPRRSSPRRPKAGARSLAVNRNGFILLVNAAHSVTLALNFRLRA